jgi:hypothetical protein
MQMILNYCRERNGRVQVDHLQTKSFGRERREGFLEPKEQEDFATLVEKIDEASSVEQSPTVGHWGKA